MANLEAFEMFHLALHYVDTLPEEDVDTVFDALQSNRPALVVAAAQVLVMLKKPEILKAIETFDSFPKTNQDMVLIFLSMTKYVECITFLLNQLESSADPNRHQLISICLAKTDYPIQPLILARLGTDDPILKERYTQLLRTIGLTKFETLLAMLPSIPHERFFRHVFGDKKIDRIKY
jgi:hypothetical protein